MEEYKKILNWKNIKEIIGDNFIPTENHINEIKLFIDSGYHKEGNCRNRLGNYIKYNLDDYVGRYKKSKELGSAITFENLKNKFGDVEGKKRWDDYCLKQKETNSYEYKNKKYNMTLEEFDNYNKSRAFTLKNSIKRHGLEKGTLLWEQCCERQRYTTTIEYFIERDGLEKGTKAFDEFSFRRQEKNWKSSGSISSAERIFYHSITNVFLEISIDTQFIIKNNKGYKIYDFIIKDKNIIIEFNGDFWHMNPKTYKATDIHPIAKYTAQEKWLIDKDKKMLAESFGFKVIDIWESDWIKDPDKVLDYIKGIIYGN